MGLEDEKIELVKLLRAGRVIWKKYVGQNLSYLDTPIMRLTLCFNFLHKSIGCDLYSGVTYYTLANIMVHENHQSRKLKLDSEHTNGYRSMNHGATRIKSDSITGKMVPIC